VDLAPKSSGREVLIRDDSYILKKLNSQQSSTLTSLKPTGKFLGRAMNGATGVLTGGVLKAVIPSIVNGR
jgi:hypothetical protein